MRVWRFFLAAALLAGFSDALAIADPPSPVPAAAAATSEGHIIKTIPGIVIDTKAREVRLEGQVCLQEGALELLVCSEGTREHESIVVVKAKPSHVTLALALLGLEPGREGFTTESGAFNPPAGEVVEITARFAAASGIVEVPAWKLLRPMGAKSGLERPLRWVYVGQPGADALRAADREGTVVCLSNFAEAVLDVPFESTAVNADLLYESNPDIVPPVGTPVELILRPTGERVAPKKVDIEVVLRKGQPPLLDGKPTDLAALKDVANALPVEVRAAALKADADESFGRVMEVRKVLEEALLKVRLMVLEKGPPPAATKPTATPARP